MILTQQVQRSEFFRFGKINDSWGRSGIATLYLTRVQVAETMVADQATALNAGIPEPYGTNTSLNFGLADTNEGYIVNLLGVHVLNMTSTVVRFWIRLGKSYLFDAATALRRAN